MLLSCLTLSGCAWVEATDQGAITQSINKPDCGISCHLWEVHHGHWGTRVIRQNG